MQLTSQTNPVKMNLTDQQIIDGLKNNEDPGQIRNLKNSFYKSYINDVYTKVIRMCRNFSDAEQLAKDITQDTFIKAFGNINKFTLPATAEPMKHRRIIMKWLLVIATNCFKKEYAIRINESNYDDIVKIIGEPIYEPFEEDSGEIKFEIQNQFRLKLQTALNLLTERERHIIVEYADEECIDSKRHLSDKCMHYLCTLYDTTPENIRQIKKRALDKIKKSCFNTDNK